MTYLTRSTGTAWTKHTSTKHILAVLRYGSGFLSVSLIQIATKIQLFVHFHLALKISHKPVPKFWCKFANRQTDRQTDNDNYISSLAEVTKLCTKFQDIFCLMPEFYLFIHCDVTSQLDRFNKCH